MGLHAVHRPCLMAYGRCATLLGTAMSTTPTSPRRPRPSRSPACWGILDRVEDRFLDHGAGGGAPPQRPDEVSCGAVPGCAYGSALVFYRPGIWAPCGGLGRAA